MKKKVLGLALLAMSMVSLTSMAQDNKQAVDGGKEKTEMVKKHKGGKKQKGERNGVKRGDSAVNPFEGLNLTESQQNRLKELQTKQATRRTEAAKAKKELKATEKQNRLTERKAAKMQYLKDVKEIVGQENYVKFLENQYVLKGGKSHKAGKKGQMAKMNKSKKMAANRDKKDGKRS